MPSKRNARSKADYDDEIADEPKTDINANAKNNKKSGKKGAKGKNDIVHDDLDKNIPKSNTVGKGPKAKNKNKRQVESDEDVPGLNETKTNDISENGVQENVLDPQNGAFEEPDGDEDVDDDFYTKKRKADRGKKKSEAPAVSKKKKGKQGKKVQEFDSDAESNELIKNMESMTVEEEDFGAYKPSRFEGFATIKVDDTDVLDESQNVSEEELVADNANDEKIREEPSQIVPDIQSSASQVISDAAGSTADPDIPVAGDEKSTAVVKVKLSKKELKKLKKREDFEKLVEGAKDKIIANSGTLDNFALSQVCFVSNLVDLFG